jgi:hypothetical protein
MRPTKAAGFAPGPELGDRASCLRARERPAAGDLGVWRRIPRAAASLWLLPNIRVGKRTLDVLWELRSAAVAELDESILRSELGAAGAGRAVTACPPIDSVLTCWPVWRSPVGATVCDTFADGVPLVIRIAPHRVKSSWRQATSSVSRKGSNRAASAGGVDRA